MACSRDTDRIILIGMSEEERKGYGGTLHGRLANPQASSDAVQVVPFTQNSTAERPDDGQDQRCQDQ